MPGQATIRRAVEAVGYSRLRQVRTRIKLRPAPAGTGVIFRRTDVGSCVAASLDFARCHAGALVLGRAPRHVEGAEELLAAVVALGLTDLIVELDGSEPPLFGGSSGPYFELLHEAGTRTGEKIVPPLQVCNPLRVESPEGWLELRPAKRLLLDVRRRAGCEDSGEQALRFEVSARSAAAHVGGAGTRPGGCDLLRHWAVELLGCLALAGRPLCAEVAAVQPTPSLAVAGLRALVAANPAPSFSG